MIKSYKITLSNEIVIISNFILKLSTNCIGCKSIDRNVRLKLITFNKN